MNNKGFVPILLIILLAIGALGYYGYRNYYSKPISKLNQTPTQLALSPSPFPTKPQPIVNGWKIYTEPEQNLFAFKYPDFMPEPSIYFPGESVVRRISSYTWQKDKMSSGDYDHKIDMYIFGPYKDTSKTDLIEWIKNGNWPYKEGSVEGIGGVDTVSYFTLAGKRAVKSVFKESGASYIRSWRVYFKTDSGIYHIDLDLQGTDTEMSSYQGVFDQILASFKFI